MNGLYGTHADLKHLDIPELRACSYSMVRQKRVAHIRGTEEEAVRLARRWGADQTLADGQASYMTAQVFKPGGAVGPV